MGMESKRAVDSIPVLVFIMQSFKKITIQQCCGAGAVTRYGSRSGSDGSGSIKLMLNIC
jgi:hypothetical protein